MALIKEKELGSGVSANYWIAEPRTDAHNKKTNVLMLLYLSKDAREEGHSHLLRQSAGTMDAYLPDGETVYAFVKESNMVKDEEGVETESNWFADAEDN